MMKSRKIVSGILVCLLIVLFVFSFETSAMAQKAAGKKVVATQKVSESGKNEQPAAKETAKKETRPGLVKKDARFWFRKGALCSTYGNNKAAIKYFGTAIKLDPKHSGAYFEQGVSYGQLGNYKKALMLIDKSLELDPQNGLFIYGRGRVHLLAGDKEKAMADFKKAADLEDEDAIAYLDSLARVQ